MLRKQCMTMGLTALLILTLFLSACGQNTAVSPNTPAKAPAWAPGLTPLAQNVVVKVGMKEVVSDAGILIGMAKGYYKDLGITIEPVRFNSGQEMINQLAGDQLDVGATVTAAGLFNAMGRDIPVKIVADKGINVAGQGYYRLVIRKDLKDSLKNYSDLRGKKLAVVATASLDEIALIRALQRGGLTVKDVQLQIIRSFPDMLVSLANKSIDAAMVIEPFIAQGIAKDIIDPWKDPADYDPDAQTAILVFGTSMTKRPEIANRFMTAYVKSVRDYNDAFVKNINKKEMIDLLCQTSVVKEAALYEKMFPVGLNPNGQLRMKGLSMDLDWFKENKLLKQDITLQEATDNQYVDFAVKTLGTYK